MSKLTVVIVAVVAAAVGFAARPWIDPPRDTGPVVPPSRSKTTVPEDFAPAGVEGEVRTALLIPDLLERTERLSALLASLGPESLEPVQAAYDSVLLDVGDTDLVLLGDWWARFDPNAAARWTQFNWSTRQSVPVLRAVMRHWGRTDPLAALAFASFAASDRVARRWTDAVLRGWDEVVPDGALQYAESLGPGPTRQWALYVVTRRRMLRDGPEPVIAWAEGLPDDDKKFKLNVIRRVGSALAAVDTEQAVGFVERHLDGPYGDGLPMRVGVAWGSQDPEAAMAWLSTLPAGPDRTRAVRETFFQWLGMAHRKATAWIESIEWAPWLDPAIGLHVKGVAQVDPRRGVELAEQIQDPEVRLQPLGFAFRLWLMSDPDEANAWLDQSDVLPADRERYRTIPESMRKHYRPAERASS